MSEVPQIWRTVLDAMPNGWTTPTAIALRLGRDVEETTDLLAAIDAAGLISVREAEDADEIVVSLSPRDLGAGAASRPSGPRDRRAPAVAESWSSSYDRPTNRSRMAVTATGSVAS